MENNAINHKKILTTIDVLQSNVGHAEFETDAVVLRQLAYIPATHFDRLSPIQANSITDEYARDATDVWQWDGQALETPRIKENVIQAANEMGQSFTGDYDENFQPTFSSFIAVSGLKVITLRKAIISGLYISEMAQKIIYGLRDAEAYIATKVRNQIEGE